MSLPLATSPRSGAATRNVRLVIVCGPLAGEFCRQLTARQPSDSLTVLSTATADLGGDTPASLSERITQIVSAGTAKVVMIECDPKTDPAALVIALSENERAGRLPSEVQLNAIVMAVDPTAIADTLGHQQPQKDAWSASSIAEQIELASLVALDSATTNPEAVALAQAVISALNPRATVISFRDDSIVERFADSLPFVFDAGVTETHWRELMDEDASLSVGEGIDAVAYRARRPFHPQRFWEFLKTEVGGVIRAKGFFWLATQMNVVAGLNVAGAEKQAAPVGEWWAAIAGGLSPGSDCPESIRKEWMEPFGDRRQSLAFIGIHLDRTKLQASLDACLLGEAEMAAGEESWLAWADPFPNWSEPAHQHECSHHDCCSH